MKYINQKIQKKVVLITNLLVSNEINTLKYRSRSMTNARYSQVKIGFQKLIFHAIIFSMILKLK